MALLPVGAACAAGLGDYLRRFAWLKLEAGLISCSQTLMPALAWGAFLRVPEFYFVTGAGAWQVMRRERTKELGIPIIASAFLLTLVVKMAAISEGLQLSLPRNRRRF